MAVSIVRGRRRGRRPVGRTLRNSSIDGRDLVARLTVVADGLLAVRPA